ncbi:hypothetical protein ACFU9F_25575 [Streptomyces zhihengii]|uniref:hypothetical protein n=1 Tax=Streptomyces zhihengii TaxID=1818004 RepID=UPI0036BF125E
MEQRIDPNTKPEFAASTNPSFVPGLTGTSPSAGAPAKTPAGAAGEQKPEDPEDAVPATDTGSDTESGEASEPSDSAEPSDTPKASETPDADADADAGADATDASETGTDTADGPVFEASDRRGSITAGRDGIVFRLDDQEADFRWDEIGAVETTPARFGRRFTVTVHTAANRWFNADVDADSRARLKEWTAGLDAVLDAYFEE